MATPISDTTVFVDVVAVDKAGRTAVDVGPFTYVVAPADAATTSEDSNFPGDTSHALVTLTVPDASGNQASFTVTATDANGLSGVTDTLVPTAGVPASLRVSLSAT